MKNYQKPIIANAGSIIFWDSRTIHSAKYQQNEDDRWRAVFYISMREKSDYSQRDIDLITRAAVEGRTARLIIGAAKYSIRKIDLQKK